jgi:MFS transporter, DHA1 family, multidrug resistance protein
VIDELLAPSESSAALGDADRQDWRLLAILSALMGFGAISTDLYLPAMPAMAVSLAAATGQIEWTVSGFLIGFSIGQLFWGAISDRYGRRSPLVIGLLLFVLGSAGCAVAGSVATMIVARIVQALGACAGVVLARAMVRDLYEGTRAVQMMSTLMTVMNIAPLLGPLIGGQILLHAGWRAIFWFLVGVGLLTLASMFRLPETLARELRDRQTLRATMVSYGRLARNGRLMAYTAAGAFFYAGMFAYIAGSPFAYITVYHVRPDLYGLLFAVGVVGMMVTNFLNARLVRRYSSDRLLLWGSMVTAAVGLVLAGTVASGFGGLAGLVVPLFVFVSMTGFIVANSIVGALALAPQRAGAVAALVGMAQYGSGVGASALIGAMADGTAQPMGYVIAGCGLGSLACARIAVRT